MLIRRSSKKKFFALPSIAPYYKAAGGGGGFVGPGDILSSASWWVSPARAYSAAYAAGVTKPAMDIVDGSGANQTTINILSTGFVDLTAIAAWVVSFGSTIKVKKLYDQSGNGRDVSQAVTANMPVLILSSLGGLPALQFTASADSFLKSASFSVATPQTVYGVIKRTANFTTWQILLADNGLDAFGGWAMANSFRISSGTTTDSAAIVSDGAFHASGWVFGSSGAFAVDGTTTSAGNVGTSTFSAGLTIGDFGGGNGFASDALVCEMGLWPVSATGTNNTNMSANQHSSTNGYNF